MRIILVDDVRARSWSPFAETRPVGELRFGALLLRERVELWLGGKCVGHRVPSEDDSGLLDGFDEPGSPPVLPAGSPGPGGEPGTLYWLSRAAPELAAAPPDLPEGQVSFLAMDGTLVGVWVPSTPAPDPPRSPSEALGQPLARDVEAHPVRGTLLGWPWELVEANARVLTADLEHLHPADRAYLPPEVHHLGDRAVSADPSSRIGPGVILDTRHGPIRLDAGVVVDGPARLVGPVHLGADTAILGGHVARTSTGPVCKLRGEVDTAVFLGFANKAHDGYLGHALVGRWVNLGAMTTNSDLKNDYGPVRMEMDGARVETGLKKVGAFLGDHVKTGIGTILNTGSMVGAGSNVFGGGMPPRTLPPFSWSGPEGVVPYRWAKFLEVARIVVARRDQPWTPGVEEVLHRLWKATHGGVK